MTPGAAVVSIMVVSPAPSIVANSMITALSWTITIGIDPKQLDSIARRLFALFSTVAPLYLTVAVPQNQSM